MGISQKQLRFVEWYLELGNASEAYRRAFEPNESSLSCGQRAWDVLRRPEITAIVEARRSEIREQTNMSVHKLLDFHYRIMSYDPNEIVSVVARACRHCYGDSFLRQWREPEYLEALAIAERLNEPFPDYAGGFGYNATKEPNPDCPMCDGRGVIDDVVRDTTKLSETARAGYGGAKRTKDGIQILLMDKQKSADAVARILGLDKASVQISTDVGQLAAAIHTEGMDPVAAARIYQKMMAGA